MNLRNKNKIKVMYGKVKVIFTTIALFLAYVIFPGLGLTQFGVQEAQADTPFLINFQGKITNVSNGTNVTNGNYQVEFKLYDALTGGTLLWTETYDNTPSPACDNLTVTNGVFNTKLGSCNSLSGIDFTGGSIYLSVNFNSDGEMSPRKQLTSSAFALIANELNGTGAIDITNTSATQAAINYDASNKLEVGVASDGFTTLTSTGTGSGFNLTGGNVGIGTAGPDRTLDILDATNPQLRLTHTDATNYVDLQGDANGDLVITPSGGDADIAGILNVNSLTTDTGGVSIAAGQSYTGAGAVTVSSGGAAALTLDSASNTIQIAANDTTLQRTAAGTYTLDLVDGSNTTFAITNSGAGGAVLQVDSLAGGGTLCLQTDNSGNISVAGAACGTGGTFSGEVDDTTNDSLTFTSDDASAPSGVNSIYRDNSGDLNLNVISGKTFNVQIADIDEYNFGATTLNLNSNTITNAGTINGLAITANTGVITSGTWQGTAIGAQYGGTGLNTSASSGVPTINAGTWQTNAITQNGVAFGGASNAMSFTAQGGANTVLVANAGAPSFSSAITVGTSVTSPTINATTALQLGGTSINTAGTLTNVAYKNQVNAFTAAQNITAQSTTALTVARAGTNYALQVDTNTASSATGLRITAAAAGGGIALAAISSGTNENLTFNAKGSGTVSIGGSSTGDILLGGGSGSTGCTVTNSTGVFTCTSTVASGVAGSSLGRFNLSGNTSGTISILPQAAAGTYNFNLPTTAGTSGYFLTSGGGAGAAMTWTDPSTITAGAVAWDDVTNPVGSQSLTFDDAELTTWTVNSDTETFQTINANSLTTGTALNIASTSLTSGALVDLNVSGTGGATNQKVINVSTTGAITGTQTTYGGYFSNTHSGGTSTNVGLYATATGGTNNYAAIFENGNVGIGTTAPGALLEVDKPNTTGISSEEVIFQSGFTLFEVVDSASIANWRFNQFKAPTINGVTVGDPGTVTNAATLYVNDAPVQGTNVTISNSYAIWVDAGTSRFDGEIAVNDSLTFASDDVSPPAGTVNSIFRDNSGDLNLNVISGKTFNVQIAGTDEYVFSNTGVDFGANNITNFGTALTAAAGLTITATSADLALATATSGNITLAPASTGSVQITSGVTTGTGTSSAILLVANSLTSGNAIDISSTSVTGGRLIDLSQSSSTFSGTGLFANFADGSGSLTGDFIDFQVNGTSTFTVNDGTETGSGGSAVANLYQASTLTLGTLNGFQFGNRHLVTVNGSQAGTNVGQFIRMTDNTALNSGQVVRGLEVQAYSGTNNNGINTGIATYGKTFGLQAETTAQAGGISNPAAVFAYLNQTSGQEAVGNAIRAYTNTATSADLFSIYQETSNFSGTAIDVSIANGTGDFDSGNFLLFSNNDDDVSPAPGAVFGVDYAGKLTVSPADQHNTVAISIDTEESTETQSVFEIISDTTNNSQTADTVKAHFEADGTLFITTTGNSTNGLCHAGSGNANNDEIVDCSGAPSDVAEYFGSTDATLAPAEVVVSGQAATELYLDGYHTSKAWVERATEGYQETLIGVISTAPAAVYGDEIFTPSENPRPVALVGRVPVKVTAENGEVKPGDYLTSSATVPGAAMKATRSGMIIGQALSGYSGSGVGSVIVFVDVAYKSIGNRIALSAPAISGSTIQGGEEQGDNQVLANPASTFVIQQQAAEVVEGQDEPVADILQLQSGDSNRFMVSSTGATSILSNLTCSEEGDCPSVLKVTQANTELFNIDARGNLSLTGTIFIKEDSFAGSVATDVDGTAEITFAYHLGTGKPVVQLTAEAQIPVFAQILEFIQDENGNYTGFVMKTFDLISGPVSAVVHYNVTGKQEGYITLGSAQAFDEGQLFNPIVIEGGEVVGGSDPGVDAPDQPLNPDDIIEIIPVEDNTVTESTPTDTSEPLAVE